MKSDDALRRETAAARLAVIGPRAVSRLNAVAIDEGAPVTARLAALQALESMGDSGAMSSALPLASTTGEMAEAAIAVLGAVARTKDPRAARAFDWLAALSLDRQAPEGKRLAALSALEGASPRHLKPVYEALAGDPSPRLAARVTRRSAGQTASLEKSIDRLPDDAALVAAMIREEADATPVTVLRKMVDALRQREQRATPAQQPALTAARGQVHQVLAGRQSRLALYDLRETLEKTTGPLPVGFLAAAAAIGDPACLEPLAAAWTNAPADQKWWREHVAEAFRAIVRREKLTRSHPAMKRILERLPAAAVLVAEARK